MGQQQIESTVARFQADAYFKRVLEEQKIAAEIAENEGGWAN